VNVPSAVNALTHPLRSLSSAIWQACRTICSLSSVMSVLFTVQPAGLAYARRQSGERSSPDSGDHQIRTARDGIGSERPAELVTLLFPSRVR